MSRPYSGASPEVMASTVAAPLEKELININGIKHIASQSSRGFTWITLMFELDRDIDDAGPGCAGGPEKSRKLSSPRSRSKPGLSQSQRSPGRIIYLVLTSSSSSLSELYDHAHSRIEQKVARIEGVGKVEVHGSPYAVRIISTLSSWPPAD